MGAPSIGNAKYFPISIDSLKDCFKDLPVDLYLQMSDQKFLKAFDKETGLDFSRLANYEAKGVVCFYVLNDDHPALSRFFARSPLMILANPDSPIEERKAAFFTAIEQTLQESFELKTLNQSGIAKAYSALQNALDGDKDFLKMFSTLLSTGPATNDFFRHAIATCAFSYILSVLAKMGSHRSLKIILFAALFHDLAKVRLPEQRRIEKKNVSVEDWAEFQQLPATTVSLIKDPLPFADEEVRMCILQHRERMDGRGYPYAMKGVHIYNLAKILAIADGFSELTIGLVDGNRYPREQALAHMKADTGRYDQKLLQLFVKAILGQEELKSVA